LKRFARYDVSLEAKIPEYKVASVGAILAVIDRVSEDDHFLSALAENPVGALKSYELTPEHREALASGDIESIEKWAGHLVERVSTSSSELGILPFSRNKTGYPSFFSQGVFSDKRGSEGSDGQGILG
jgi:hypothetical protein